MSEQKGRIDRRKLLQIVGSAGATGVVFSGCGGSSQTASAHSGGGLTGGKWEKTVALATAGPGGNPNWQPGDAVKFLPSEKIPTSGKASGLLASLPKDKLLTIYQRMNLSRKWETTMKDLFVAGKDRLYGAFHTYVGEEAIACGVMGALQEDDCIASTHRGHGHLIAKGGDLNKMSAEIFFKETGYNKGYGGSMHITDMSKGIMGMNGIVGASFYLAAGAAIRGRIRGTKQVAVAFCGDGAAASPYYFSAIRSCTNYKIPVIFVVENNFQYMGIPMAAVVPTKYICEYTKGLGIPHFLVDGNDVTAVYAATKEAVDGARAGNGPSLIEGLTYRWYDHSGFAGARPGVDGASGLPYRSDEEVRLWMSRDPIARFKAWLLAKKLATGSELAKIEADARAAVDASIAFARQSKDPDPQAGVLNTYAAGSVPATQFFQRSEPATFQRSGPATVS
ncbi:MAG: thiamine pyrophosphate-dependent dehydrogenase E1 component subunit alpha [Acidobacteria bacterium]|nr:thiamine pyrophosphate-dependent dehydrogenase E1 component subunit alpha [Acidobacteriota bacterium]